MWALKDASAIDPLSAASGAAFRHSGGSLPPMTLRRRAKGRVLAVMFVAWVVSLVLYLSDVSGHQAPSVMPATIPDLPPTRLRRAPYSEWVHRHWVRVAGANVSAIHAVLDEYAARSIAVDAVIVDAGWSLGDLKASVAQLRRRSGRTRVVIFASALLAEGSAEYAVARAKKFLLRDGAPVVMPATAARPSYTGALLDYTSREAVEWWHEQLRPLLRLKLDGLKNEASDAAFAATFGGAGVVAAGGHLDRDAWARAMYHDFFDFGRRVCGFDFVTMFRPVDSIGGGALQSFGPPDISFAAWVGDHAISFAGMREALHNTLHSARRGYINLGMSIGGAATTHSLSGDGGVGADAGASREFPDPAHSTPVARCLRHVELFVRWAQLGAALPIMENGGLSHNHLPWRLCDQYGPGIPTPPLATSLYRAAVQLHAHFAPFFFAVGARTFYEMHHTAALADLVRRPLNESHGITGLSLTPLFEGDAEFAHPDDWEFVVGTDLFVAPIIKSHFDADAAAAALAGADTTPAAMDAALERSCRIRGRVVRFPRFGGQQWVRARYNPEDAGAFTAGARVPLDIGIGDSLLFRRRGAILPVADERVPGATAARLHLTIDHPMPLRLDSFRARRGLPAQLRDIYTPDTPIEFVVVHGEHDAGVVASYTTPRAPPAASQEAAPGRRAFMLQLRLTQHARPVLIAIRGVGCPTGACVPEQQEGGFVVIDGGEGALAAEVSSGSRRVIVRDMAVAHSATVWVFDPFASLGSLLTLGPFEAT